MISLHVTGVLRCDTPGCQSVWSEVVPASKYLSAAMNQTLRAAQRAGWSRRFDLAALVSLDQCPACARAGLLTQAGASPALNSSHNAEATPMDRDFWPLVVLGIFAPASWVGS